MHTTFTRSLANSQMATATAIAAKAVKPKVTKKEKEVIVPVLTEEAPTKPKRQSKKKASSASSGSGSGSESEKKTKAPSSYNIFMKVKMAELKADEEYMKTERKHKEIFADAAKLWDGEKNQTEAEVKADPAFAKASKKDIDAEIKKRLALKYPAPKKEEAEKPATPVPTKAKKPKAKKTPAKVSVSESNESSDA